MVGSLSLLVGTRNGLLKFQSEDKGETWRPTDNVETNRSVQLVVADRNDTSTAYGVSYSGLVFASYDGGLTWKEMPPKLGCRMVHSIYPMNYKSLRLLVGASPSRLVMWINRGWRPMDSISGFIKQHKWISHRGNAKITSILHDPKNTKKLYVGIEVGGVVKSEDGGNSWEEASNRINPDVHCLVFGEHSDSIYAATEDGIYVSENDGTRWIFRADGLSLRYTTAIVRHHTQRMLFVAGAKEPFGKRTISGSSNIFSLFRSENDGDTWQNLAKQIGTKLLHGIGTKSLIVDNAEPYGIYFSTYDGRIFQSLDFGETFTLILKELPLTYSIAIRHFRTLDV